MAVTRLERKGRKNKNVAKNRVATMKRLNTVPSIKNIDIEEIKKEFASKGKKAASKKEKVEKPEAEAVVEAPAQKEEKKKAPKKEAIPAKEENAKVEAKDEETSEEKKKSTPKAKKEDPKEEDK